MEVKKVSTEEEEEEKIIIKKKDLITKKASIGLRYDIEKVIGKGRFGTVLKAIEKKTQKVVAIKKISKWNFSSNEQVRKEIQFLSELDHPHTEKLYEWSEDEQDYYLISEYYSGGELFERIKKCGKLTENYAAYLFRQLLLGLHYLHSVGIAHRDLKPENCMLSSEAKDSTIKLIDFGLAKIFADPKNGKVKMFSKVGTPYYIAPEVLQEDYTEKCDLWSAGVILYASVLGGLPFGGKTCEAVFDCIRKGFRGFPKGCQLSLPCQSMIRALLVSKPEDRISAKDALDHPWLKILDPAAEILEVPPKVVDNLSFYQGLQKLKKAVIALISTQLEESETEELRKIFMLIDEDKDGRISPSELEKHISGFKNHDELVALMKTMDLDSSGYIEYNEFIAAALPANCYLYISKLSEAFDTCDLNHDSKISPLEIKTLIDKDNLLPESFWSKVVDKYDLNKDGFIDFPEFISMMKNAEAEAMMLD